MAVTQNTYTGNGTTTNYSFTFPYLETTDIKVSLNGTLTTAYTLANATTVSFNTAPANGAAIRIYRDTDDAALAAAFYPGSAIRAVDLNDNFTQNLYTTQEVKARYLDRQSGEMDTAYVPSQALDVVTKGYMETNYGTINEVGFTRWRQVATASQTIFSGAGSYGNTLSFVPNREQVYLNGVLQQINADYTSATDGLSITFNTGLTVGDIVDIVCINNLVQNSTTNSADFDFVQAGTGAITRTVESKLRDVVSVKDFGAVGDGVTDDTAAIQAAIGYAQDSGQTLRINRGTYKITDSLLVTKNIHLCGDGIGRTVLNLVTATQKPAIKVYTTVALANTIIGGGISDISINCGNTGDGILVSALYPYPITRAVYQNINIRDTKIGVKAISDTANIVYMNTFRNILVNGNTYEYGVFTSGACYNLWQNIETSDVRNGAYGFKMTEAGSVLQNLTGDGVCDFDLPYGTCSNIVIETVAATTPPVPNAMRFIRVSRASNLTLLDVDNAKCSYGIVLGNSRIWVDNVTIFNPTTTPPTYQLSTSGGNGVISNFETSGGFDVEQYEPDITQRYVLVNCPTLTKYRMPGAANGTQSAVPNNTPTTVYTFPQSLQATFLVTVGIIGPGASSWTSSYLVVIQQTTSVITALRTGSFVTASTSGLSLQVTQTSGAPGDVIWSCTQIN